jgi:hypothetical protein
MTLQVKVAVCWLLFAIQTHGVESPRTRLARLARQSAQTACGLASNQRHADSLHQQTWPETDTQPP